MPQVRLVQPEPRPSELAPARPAVQPHQQNDFLVNDYETPSSREKPSSATGMMNSLGSHAASPEPWQQAAPPPRSEPLPSYRPPVSLAVSAPSEPGSQPGREPGSVTQFIQRLSQEPREAPQPAPPAAVPLSDSGPGEFTRMISAGQMRSEPRFEAAAEPAGQASSPQPGSFAAPSMPKLQQPKPPVIPVPAITPPVLHATTPAAAAHVPKFEMPAVATPKLTPPALAAPQAKMPALVPILLVVNTFLLIVLLVVVIFAMRK